ncbi:MAG TPA: hypothetical protein VHR47_02090 [Bacillota bacterium]|jgi:hypothetical protein|nr:hypothetical protein [Bacillota bacterium]
MSDNNIVSIGANCLVQVNNRFFLAAEIEVNAPGIEIGPDFFIELTAAQFEALRSAGEMLCTVQDTIPVAQPGFDVEFKCIFFVEDQVFLVFDVENSTDESVLVRTSPLDALQRLQQGAHFCTILTLCEQ